jgi:hypothetical protein
LHNGGQYEEQQAANTSRIGREGVNSSNTSTTAPAVAATSVTIDQQLPAATAVASEDSSAPTGNPALDADSAGPMGPQQEYERLKAENERLKAENARMAGSRPSNPTLQEGMGWESNSALVVAAPVTKTAAQLAEKAEAEAQMNLAQELRKLRHQQQALLRAQRAHVVQALVRWARGVTPFRQGTLKQLSMQRTAQVGGNVALEVRFKNERKAVALVLPNSCDFRSVPQQTVNRWVLAEMVEGMARTCHAARRKQAELKQLDTEPRTNTTNEAGSDAAGDAAGEDDGSGTKPTGGSGDGEMDSKGGDAAGELKLGLAILVVAGEGELAPEIVEQLKEAGGQAEQKKEGSSHSLLGSRGGRRQEHGAVATAARLDKLGQFLCRGLPEAMARLAEKNINLVVVDSASESYTNSLVAQALSAWRMPVHHAPRLLGVIEIDSEKAGRQQANQRGAIPDLGRVDQLHTHLVALRKRQSTKYVDLADAGMKSCSTKIDVADKLGHCFTHQLLASSRPFPMVAGSDSLTLNQINGGNLENPGAESNIKSLTVIPRSAPVANGTAGGSGGAPGAAQDAQAQDTKADPVPKGRIREVAAYGAPTPLQEALQGTTDELLSLVHGPLDDDEVVDDDVLDNDEDGDVPMVDGKSSKISPRLQQEAMSKSDQRRRKTNWLTALGVQRLWAPTYVVLLVSGGDKARVDVLHACRRGWDIVVFQGTGGLADCIAAALAKESGDGDGKRTAVRQVQSKSGPKAELKGDEATPGQLNPKRDDKPVVSMLEGSKMKDVVVDEIVSTGKIALISVDKDNSEELSAIVYSRLVPLSDDLSPDDCGPAGMGSVSTASMLGLVKARGNNNGGGYGKIGVEMQGRDTNRSVLLHAWRRYAEYMQTSHRLRRSYLALEGCLMGLALLTTLLVALDSDIRYNSGEGNTWSEAQTKQYNDVGGQDALKFFIGLSPILISVVLSVKNKFNFLAKYIALQEAAGTLKREIFKFRTTADEYRDPRNRKMCLSKAIRAITTKLMQTEACSVSVVSMEPQHFARCLRDKDSCFREAALQLHPSDDALSNMDASEYVEYRIEYQLQRYRDEGGWLNAGLKALECGGYTLNGLAIAMILVNQEVWVATLIVLLNILSNIVAVVQYEDRLVRTNDAIVTLDCTSSWWNTLDEGDQIKQELLNKMINITENVIFAHIVGGLAKSKEEEDMQIEGTEQQSTKGQKEPDGKH